MPDNTSSRKFVDLIYETTSKWASWNPGHQIKVGEYGKIDKNSGEFDRMGNIYEDTYIYKDEAIAKLVKDHSPQSTPRDENFIATSLKVSQSNLKSDAHAEVPGLANASIKGQWAFGSERGALLIMAQPWSSYISSGTILEPLAQVKALEGMSLVTEVFFCPAYSLYLSSGNNDVVNLALVGSFSIPHAPVVTAGGELGGKWWVQNTTGLFRNGRDHHGKDIYTPLYSVKKIRKKSRFGLKRGVNPPKLEGDDLYWVDVQPPWDLLDEDGNEKVFEDTVFNE